ncbi:MAG: Rab family GTPase [Candidatus Baldrarchaeia archaeon]
MSEEKEYVFKVIVVGDERVGKTSIIMRYTENRFPVSYKPSLGSDIAIKVITIKGLRVKLAIWDIAGHQVFERIRRYYYTGAAGAIVMYDITNPRSFENVEKWCGDVREHCGNIPCILVGNKIDLKDERKVTTDMGKSLAEKLKFNAFIESSAKTGENVHEVFQRLTREMLKSPRA